MPKCQVQILTPAWRDIDRISDYHLTMVGPESAERITDKLLDTIAKLSEFPLMGAEHPDPVLARHHYRKILCGDYVCVYRMVEDTVYIYRVVHGATDYTKYFK